MLGYTIGMAIDTELSWYGDKFIKQVGQHTIIALIKATNKVQADAKLIVAKDTTALEGSIVKSVDKVRLVGEVSTNMEYAFAQEFGRPDLEKYTYTPYMRPSLKNNIPYITKTFIEEERKAIGN